MRYKNKNLFNKKDKNICFLGKKMFSYYAFLLLTYFY